MSMLLHRPRPLLLMTLLIFAPGTDGAEDSPLLLGADLSYVNEMEDCGAIYRADGQNADPYELFARRGANIVRLRLWHTPTWTKYGTFEDVVRSSRRAEAVRMHVLLDFHYSDDWADPGDQIIPKAWQGYRDIDELAEQVYRYTTDTLLALHEAGVMPYMVQVGNETNTEILLRSKVEESHPIDWERNAALLNAGIVGVAEAGRLAGQTPKVMLHIAQPENVEPWFDDAFAAGILDFDVIGISYYPKWSSRNLHELGRTIRRIRHKYQKDVILVETAYPWTLLNNDAAGNILGEDSLVEEYPATLSGQSRFLKELTQTVISSDGSGVVYWEPAWVSSECSTRWGKGSHWENNTFFDYETTSAHSGFDFLSHSYSLPVAVEFRFKSGNREVTGPFYLRASFLEGNDFAVKLVPEDGEFRYVARLPAGSRIQYQLYATPGMEEGLLSGGGTGRDGVISMTVGDDGLVVTESLDVQ
jgi:arabinogalactan endo-1,4-beta-galactosidase